MVENSPKTVAEYTKKILLGLVLIEFCVIDRRPDLKQFDNLRKFLHVTSVYVVGFKVFESEVISHLIGNASTGFCLEKDPINVMTQSLESEYKQIYLKQSNTGFG